ncbi:hypothetical protein [Jannaschia sp. LMIT008]|uniref:hypothetical protein n=1 Tax=Jannaschia maritima TaxID=3032585 RepID=UPI0028118935|nr:hypothetical protein [Jannaschia sp. LMIT008]
MLLRIALCAAFLVAAMPADAATFRFDLRADFLDLTTDDPDDVRPVAGAGTVRTADDFVADRGDVFFTDVVSASVDAAFRRFGADGTPYVFFGGPADAQRDFGFGIEVLIETRDPGTAGETSRFDVFELYFSPSVVSLLGALDVGGTATLRQSAEGGFTFEGAEGVLTFDRDGALIDGVATATSRAGTVAFERVADAVDTPVVPVPAAGWLLLGGIAVLVPRGSFVRAAG